MKNKNLKKFNLGKITISRLSSSQLDKLNGGGDPVDCASKIAASCKGNVTISKTDNGGGY